MNSSDFCFSGYLFQCDRLNPSPSGIFQISFSTCTLKKRVCETTNWYNLTSYHSSTDTVSETDTDISIDSGKPCASNEDRSSSPIPIDPCDDSHEAEDWDAELEASPPYGKWNWLSYHSLIVILGVGRFWRCVVSVKGIPIILSCHPQAHVCAVLTF